MSSVVEVRCPHGPRRLFTKLRFGAELVRYVQPGNLCEFACSDCSKNRDVRVFHRYNFLGELVETVTEPKQSAG